MGINFRKRISLGSGVRLNVSKSGISTTIGTRGASVNIGKGGAYLNTSLPGTGLYSRSKISSKSNGSTSSIHNATWDDITIIEWFMEVFSLLYMMMMSFYGLFPHRSWSWIILLVGCVSFGLFWILWFVLGAGDEQKKETPVTETPTNNSERCIIKDYV